MINQAPVNQTRVYLISRPISSVLFTVDDDVSITLLVHLKAIKRIGQRRLHDRP